MPLYMYADPWMMIYTRIRIIRVVRINKVSFLPAFIFLYKGEKR